MDVLSDYRALFDFYAWLFPSLTAFIGLLVGSFLNVVIARLPKMMEQEWRHECAISFPESQLDASEPSLTLSRPASHCPSCKTPIRIVDNIPILSWLLLRGKCHNCATSISIRYPAVELLTAILSFAVAYKLGLSGFTLGLIVLTWVLIAASFIDFDTMLLPDQLTLPLMWAGILLALIQVSPVSLPDSVIGAMAGYGFLWSLYWAFKLLTGKEGMGYGDFKLLAALGAWLGWQALPMIILVSSLVGLVFGLIQLYMSQKGLNKAFPFGPYLAIAGWISLMFGEQISAWYFQSILGIY